MFAILIKNRGTYPAPWGEISLHYTPLLAAGYGDVIKWHQKIDRMGCHGKKRCSASIA
jgi:hypothetical protein